MTGGVTGHAVGHGEGGPLRARADQRGAHMITQDMVPLLFGDEVYDANGEKIGKVGQVYLDDETGQPAWVTVRTGLFGMKESFVP
ncbi:MAG TPA: PRC-barrel domain-containing protein, partial [Pseudonocardiaceae bacterium]